MSLVGHSMEVIRYIFSYPHTEPETYTHRGTHV